MALFALIFKNGKQKYSMWIVWDDTSWPVKAKWPRRKPAKRRVKEKKRGTLTYLKAEVNEEGVSLNKRETTTFIIED